MRTKYIHKAIVIAQRFEKEIIFLSENKITKADFYGTIYEKYGFNKNGKAIMLRIEQTIINKSIQD